MLITIANQVLAHKHIAGVRTIWQNQLAHHITELNARMNSNDDVGEITWLRLHQAQLDCKSISCITQKDTSRLEKMKVNGNLNLKIITEAKELGINFDFYELESSLQLARDGNEIVEWLEGKNIGGFCQNSNMNLFILEQLLNEEGSN